MSSTAIGALLQVLVFSAVPFLVYVIRHRKVGGFFRYVGMYRPEARTMGWATALVLIVTPLLLWAFSLPGLRELATAPATTVGLLRRLEPGGEALVILLLYAWVQTALSEEILFRGFLAQRLITWLGFDAGNLVQALIFGIVHLALFLALAGEGLQPIHMLVLLLVPTAIGWALGVLKVRRGNGSIVPGWWAHGLSNLIAFATMGFLWE